MYSNSPATFADSAARRNLPRSDRSSCSSATVTWQPRFHFTHEPGEQRVQITPRFRGRKLRLTIPHFRRLADVRLKCVNGQAQAVLAVLQHLRPQVSLLGRELGAEGPIQQNAHYLKL